MMRVILLTLLLVTLAVPFASAQDGTGPMQPVAGIRALDALALPVIYPLRHTSGDQTWVRKYEGNQNSFLDIQTLDLLGYDVAWQHFVKGYDLLSGDPLLDARLGYADTWWARARINQLTWRIPIIPLRPPAEPGEVLLPATLFDPFKVDTSINHFSLAADPWKNRPISLFGDIWWKSDEGNMPLPFRTRVGSPTRPNRTKFETTEPVDQTTTEPGIGANFRLGSAALSYKTSITKFNNSTTGPLIPSDFAPDEPIRQSRFENTRTRNHELRLAVPVRPNISLTGNWINRDRTHSTSGISLANFNGLLVPSDVSASLQTRSAAIRYIVRPQFLLTAKYRAFDLDRDAPLIAVGTPTPIVQNQSVSRNQKDGEILATYTGVRSTILKAGYNISSIDRDIRAVHQPVGTHIEPNQEEWEHPFMSTKTDKNTLRLAGTTYLVPSVTLKADWRISNISGPTFHGSPSDIDDLNLGLTYSRKDDFVFFADYRRLDENNNNIPAPGFLTVATLTDPEEYTERRESSAGAQFDNNNDSLVLGAYKSIGNRLTVDANFMWDKTRSNAFWILGIDPNFPPHVGGEGDPTGLPPEFVPYRATNKIWSAGATFAYTPQLTFRANLMSGSTNGVTTTDSLFRLVPPVGSKERDWQPLAVNYSRVAIGATYTWKPRQRIYAEISRNSWSDEINPSFDGAFTLVTLGLVRSF